MNSLPSADALSIARLDAYCAPGNIPLRFGAHNPYPALCTPLGQDWREVTRESKMQWWASTNEHFRTKVWPDFDMRVYDLRDKIVAFGGEEVCMPYGEPEVEELISRGQLWGATSRMQIGVMSQCHRNSAKLWAKNQDKCFIATGYALSEDGLWRGHTWCVKRTSRGISIIETTVPRLLYFGYVLTLEESIAFETDHEVFLDSINPVAVSLHNSIYHGDIL
jgi:hypothetical protein